MEDRVPSPGRARSLAFALARALLLVGVPLFATGVLSLGIPVLDGAPWQEEFAVFFTAIYEEPYDPYGPFDVEAGDEIFESIPRPWVQSKAWTRWLPLVLAVSLLVTLSTALWIHARPRWFAGWRKYLLAAAVLAVSGTLVPVLARGAGRARTALRTARILETPARDTEILLCHDVAGGGPLCIRILCSDSRIADCRCLLLPMAGPDWLRARAWETPGFEIALAPVEMDRLVRDLEDAGYFRLPGFPDIQIDAPPAGGFGVLRVSTPSAAHEVASLGGDATFEACVDVLLSALARRCDIVSWQREAVGALLRRLGETRDAGLAGDTCSELCRLTVLSGAEAWELEEIVSGMGRERMGCAAGSADLLAEGWKVWGEENLEGFDPRETAFHAGFEVRLWLALRAEQWRKGTLGGRRG